MDVLEINSKAVGQLLKYYRKKLDMSRKDIADKNPSLSVSAIQRAEEGRYVSKDKMNLILEIYDRKLCDDKIKFFTLERYIKETYLIINSGKPLTEYGALKHKIKDFYKENKQYLLLNEVSRICISTIDMYLSSRLEDKDIADASVYIYPALNSKHLLYLVISYMLNMYHSYYLAFIEYEPYNYGEILQDNKLFYLDGFFYDITHINTFELYAKYNIFNSNERNIYKKYTSCFANAFLGVCIQDYKKANIYLSKVSELYQKYQSIIPSRFLYHYYEIEAIYNYNLKNYKEAFEYSYNIYKDFDKIMDFSYLVLFKSAEKLNDNDLIIKILEETNNSKKINENLFEYYKAKHIDKVDNLKLQKMIYKLFNYQNNKSYSVFNFFLDELIELSKESDTYDCLLKFIETKDVYIKDIGLLK